MPNPKARAVVLHASPEDAEAQFYDALRDGDLDRVMAVWADDEDIVCVHPGGARVVGPQAVRAAFEAIFASGQLAVHPEHVKVVHAMGSARTQVQKIAIGLNGQPVPCGKRSGAMTTMNSQRRSVSHTSASSSNCKLSAHNMPMAVICSG